MLRHTLEKRYLQVGCLFIFLLNFQISKVVSWQQQFQQFEATKSLSRSTRYVNGFQGHRRCHPDSSLGAAKGFGASSSSSSSPNKIPKSKNAKSSGNKEQSQNKPFIKSEQEDLIEQLAARSAGTAVGQVVAEALASGKEIDPFWELIPSLISSRFPKASNSELSRIAGFVRHTLNPELPLEDEVLNNPFRPAEEFHAYMPGLGPTSAFHDPNQLELCRLLSENFETIRSEYDALLADIQSKPEGQASHNFQSVTSMNYDAGWKTLVLFYNGHRIPKFPYHLCPTTTRILETVPLAGRIAGFNRQQPRSGIPLHTDGNNMWLTCQMGIYVPEGQAAYIRVGDDTRRWKEGECLLYDTTYEHETMNEHESQERVVLHVDFFNTLRMTPIEVEVMQYIYSLREQFMKAEGVAKVGAQIL